MMLTTSHFARALGATAVAAALIACGPRNEDVAADSAALGGDTAAVATATGTVERDMSEAGILGLLAAANAGEVEAANVALEKARNARVREFAQRMKTDHSAMLQKGEQLGQSLGLQPVVPRDEDDLVREHKDNMRDLADETGEFDDEYMDAMVEEHEETLDMIDRSLEATQNAQLRQMLQEARPKVEEHLNLAKQIKDQID